MNLKPFFTYYGGKFRSAPHYPVPKKRSIVEPFAGSAGYSLRYPDREITLCDVDGNIVLTWQYLIGVSPNEILSLPDLLPGQSVGDLPICQEAKILIGWWLNKGAASPCKTPSSWMRSGTHPNSFWGDAVRQRIAGQVEHIRHWQIIQCSYHECSDRDATWFVDPPYIEAGRLYRFGSSKIDYDQLGQWCKNRIGQVIVCENEGAEWLPFRPFIETKSNPSSRGKASSREAIWTQETESVP